MHQLDLPLWTVLPFAGLLLSIAVLPLVAHHWWERNFNKGVVAALFSLPVAVYLVVALGSFGVHELIEKGKEYVSFILLLGSSFAEEFPDTLESSSERAVQLTIPPPPRPAEFPAMLEPITLAVVWSA